MVGVACQLGMMPFEKRRASVATLNGPCLGRRAPPGRGAELSARIRWKVVGQLEFRLPTLCCPSDLPRYGRRTPESCRRRYGAIAPGAEVPENRSWLPAHFFRINNRKCDRAHTYSMRCVCM